MVSSIFDHFKDYSESSTLLERLRKDPFSYISLLPKDLIGMISPMAAEVKNKPRIFSLENVHAKTKWTNIAYKIARYAQFSFLTSIPLFLLPVAPATLVITLAACSTISALSYVLKNVFYNSICNQFKNSQAEESAEFKLDAKLLFETPITHFIDIITSNSNNSSLKLLKKNREVAAENLLVYLDQIKNFIKKYNGSVVADLFSPLFAVLKSDLDFFYDSLNEYTLKEDLIIFKKKIKYFKSIFYNMWIFEVFEFDSLNQKRNGLGHRQMIRLNIHSSIVYRFLSSE